MNTLPASEVTRVLLLVIFVSLLLVGTLWTLSPFISALIWATTISVATWPALLRLERATGGRRSFAVLIMTALVLVAFVVPFLLAITTLLDAANRSPAVLADFLSRGLGPAPSWLADLPGGERATARWNTIADGGPTALVDVVRPHARAFAAWAIAATGGAGMIVVQLLLIVILVAILFSKGEIAANGVLSFARRMGGIRGEQTAVLAAKAVRSVAMGVIVTALVQSLLAGLGLWVSGVPHAGILLALVFVLGIAQLGPLPILGPAVAWLYWTDAPIAATGLLVWSIPVITLDNVLRPILIRRGVELPLLLIIAGVIGGLITFGVLGLFVGPVLLAATYTLTKAWIAEPTIDVRERVQPVEGPVVPFDDPLVPLSAKVPHT